MSAGVLWSAASPDCETCGNCATPLDFQKGLNESDLLGADGYDESFHVHSRRLSQRPRRGCQGRMPHARRPGGGPGLTIAATGQWWTGQFNDYARFAERTGAMRLLRRLLTIESVVA